MARGLRVRAESAHHSTVCSVPSHASCGHLIAVGFAEQCQLVGASMGLQKACPANDDKSCQVSCQDPTDSSRCVVLQSALIDGSPCGECPQPWPSGQSELISAFFQATVGCATRVRVNPGVGGTPSRLASPLRIFANTADRGVCSLGMSTTSRSPSRSRSWSASSS